MLSIGRLRRTNGSSIGDHLCAEAEHATVFNAPLAPTTEVAFQQGAHNNHSVGKWMKSVGQDPKTQPFRDELTDGG